MKPLSIYKIIHNGRNWNSVCASLIWIQRQSITSGVYAYVLTDRKTRPLIKLLIHDLQIEDNTCLVAGLSDIPVGSKTTPHSNSS